MSSSFLGLEIGKRGLSYHQRALDVVGHNLNNAENKAYSRQRVAPVTVRPLTDASLAREERPGQVGQGVEIASIRRERDMYLEDRINTHISDKAYWTDREGMLTDIENVHMALGDRNLQSRLDEFWSGWQEMALRPSEPATRHMLIQRSENLTRGLNQQHQQLDTLRFEVNEKVISQTRKVNDISSSIADINTRILKAKAVGDNPNDLEDRRDAMIAELSELVDVRLSVKDNDEIMVHVGGRMLIQGTRYNPLELRDNPAKGGMADIYWSDSQDPLTLKSGELKSKLDVRDFDLPDQMRQLDSIALNLMRSVNEVHQQGADLYGENGQNFFVQKGLTPNLQGNWDSDGDGALDRTVLQQVRGLEKLQGDQVIGEAGTLTLAGANDQVNINYQADETVNSLLNKINLSNSGINASLNEQGQLILKARSSLEQGSFQIEQLADSGAFLHDLSGLLNNAAVFDAGNVNAVNSLRQGVAQAEVTPAQGVAGWIDVNPLLKGDIQRIAAAAGVDFDGDGNVDRSEGRDDNRIALEIAAIRESAVYFDDKRTFNDFYAHMIDQSASGNATAKREMETQDAILANLEQVRESVSGVNIDEEMTNMISLQHGYQAAARVVTAMDRMLDVLINRMAV